MVTITTDQQMADYVRSRAYSVLQDSGKVLQVDVPDDEVEAFRAAAYNKGAYFFTAE